MPQAHGAGTVSHRQRLDAIEQLGRERQPVTSAALAGRNSHQKSPENMKEL
jgi:hypothetical protein